MIKLLNYIQESDRTILNFSKNEHVIFYPFCGGIFTVTSDGITKSAVKNIKQYVQKNGLKADLAQFINKEFESYDIWI